MNYSERQKSIIEILLKKKTASIKELSDSQFISISTLRRDLIRLEGLGIIKRFHGGASIVSGTTMEYSSRFRENENKKQKEYIAKLARDFITGGMCIFLDSSSTVLNICPLLSEYPNITVVTNGLRTALELYDCDNINTYVSGGLLKKHSSTLIGNISNDFFSEFKADLAILSCRGIDRDGIYEADKEQAVIKQNMIKNSRQSILLCDSSKFNRSYFCRLCSYNDIAAVITDQKPDFEFENSCCDILY